MQSASSSPFPNVSNIIGRCFFFSLSLSLNISKQQPAAMDPSKWISNQTDNSFTLAHQLLSEDSNIVFSPLSIHVLLGMIAAGSNDPTRDQIVSFVTATSSDELTAFFSEIVSPTLDDGSPLVGPLLSTANGLWVDRSLHLKPAFRDILTRVYRAKSKHVDFQNKAREVCKQVNKWGSKQTNGLVKNVLPPDAVGSTTKLILANAVYFKGKWTSTHIFDASLTEKHKFYLLDGTSVKAPLMSSYKKQYFRAFDGFKVVSLPYEQGKDTREFSMHIYLPDARDGLPALRERVCSESGFIDTHLPNTMESLDKFLVPKFKFDFHFEAIDVLKRMGLVLPFKDSQLTEMVECSSSSSLPLKVSAIYHKAFIEVNEEGTEAAAVSVAVIRQCLSIPMKRKRLEFVADHPFLFVIREDTKGIVFFIGQLLNPLA